ncbi:MAG TPA: DUF3300 domain-containing protein [Candidatus Acidoferrales bacterium]|nr:DUF3300 domain-containing protein [Candidatus Acidoferrales bacterium]
MIKKALAVALSICLVYAPMLGYAAISAPGGSASSLAQDQDEGGFQPYTPEQLDNLLAPIALYPDPLLAQVLPAATFPDQIDQAAQYVTANGQNGVDDQPWDVSVKAVAHYPAVLNMMDQKLDWTTAVGQAYVYQSTDLTEAIQRLRHMAYSRRNLITSPQQEVIVEGGYIQIIPAQPRYIYVPVYNPAVVYVRPAAFGIVAISFGAGLFIGAWLNRDWDWGGRGIYYTGWQGGGWIARSRSFVQVNNNVYVNNSYRSVTINRTVINRTVNYNNINTYNSVHNNVNYNNRVTNNTFNRNGNTYNRNTNNNTFNRNGNTYNRDTNNNTFNRNGNAYNRNRNNNTFNRNGSPASLRPNPPAGQYQPQQRQNTFNRNGNTPNRNTDNNTFNRNGSPASPRPNPPAGQYQPQQRQAQPQRGRGQNNSRPGAKGGEKNKQQDKHHPGA